MNISKRAVAGTLQSNDCFIEVLPSEDFKINIDSIVFNEFSEVIEDVIKNTLNELDVKNVELNINDKGALDCTIKARVETAVKRANE